MRIKIILICFLLIFLVNIALFAASNDKNVMGYVSAIQDKLYIQKADSVLIDPGESNMAEKVWEPALIGTAFKEGDRIKTGASGYAELKFNDGSKIKLSNNTVITIKTKKTDKGFISKIKINVGKIWCNIVSPRAMQLDIETPAANATIRGTEFEVNCEKENLSVLSVYNGTVEFYNDYGAVTVGKLQESIAETGKAPSEPVSIQMEQRRWFNKYIIHYERTRESFFKDKEEQEKMKQSAIETLKTNPLDGRANAVLGEVSLEEGNFTDAGHYFEAALNGKYEEPFVYLGLGEFYINEGDNEKAQNFLKKAYDLKNDSSVYLLRYTDLLISAEKYPEAEGVIKDYLIKKPDDEKALLQLGFIYLMSKQVNEAEGIFKQIITANPDNMEAVTYLAFIYKTTGRIDEAEALYSKIAVSKEAPSEYKFMLGQYYIDSGKFDEAVNIFNELKESDNPFISSEANFYLGLLEFMYNHFKTANVYFEKAYSINNKEAVFLAYIASTKYLMDDVKGAYKDVLTARDMDPYLEAPHRFLYFFYSLQGKYEESLKEVNILIKVDSDNPLWYYFKGLTEDALLSFVSSAESYRAYANKVKELQDSGMFFELMDYYLGSYYYNTGKPKEAIPYFNKCIEKTPEVVFYYRLRYGCYKELKHYEAAQVDVMSMIDISPEYGDNYRLLSELFDVMGREYEREQSLNKAITLQPTNARAHRYLGDYYMTRNIYPPAVTEYQKSLNLYINQLNEQGADQARSRLETTMKNALDF